MVDESGWTPEQLKVLLDERAMWQERLRVAEKEAIKHRIDELNNLRQEYTHDRGGFVTIVQLESFKEQTNDHFDLLGAGLTKLERAVEANTANRTGLAQGLGYVFGAVGLVLAIAAFVIAH